MKKEISFPPAWLGEVRESYLQYRAEWEREETERTLGTGDDPEPPQGWDDFLIEYHYAELEACISVGSPYGCK